MVLRTGAVGKKILKNLETNTKQVPKTDQDDEEDSDDEEDEDDWCKDPKDYSMKKFFKYLVKSVENVGYDEDTDSTTLYKMELNFTAFDDIFSISLFHPSFGPSKETYKYRLKDKDTPEMFLKGFFDYIYKVNLSLSVLSLNFDDEDNPFAENYVPTMKGYPFMKVRKIFLSTRAFVEDSDDDEINITMLPKSIQDKIILKRK